MGKKLGNETRWTATMTKFVAMAALLLGFTAVPLAEHVAAQDNAPSLAIVWPAAGDVITGATIDIKVEIKNFSIDCAIAGLPDEESVGHVHVMIDGMTMGSLTGFYCSNSFSISGDGLTAGPHTLVVDLSSNTHMDMMDTAQEVEIDYQPENLVALPVANFTGAPGVELVSPLDGATVGSKVTIEVKGVNFTVSENLEGKANVPGYGHWHVFVDTDMSGMMGMMGDEASPMAEDMDMEGGTPEAGMEGEGTHMDMMSMAGMVAMPGTDTFEIDLSAWGPGEHTIWIEPVQNDHTTYEELGWVEFKVTVDPNA